MAPALPMAPELLVVSILVFAILFQTINHKVMLLLTILGLYYVYDYKTIHRSFQETIANISDTTEPQDKYIIKVDGYKDTLDINSHTQDPTIKDILKRLRKYRRYNKVAYEKGKTLLIQWHHGILQLESDIPHPRQVYENTETYYQQALREFEGLGVASPSMSYGQSLTKKHKKDQKKRDVKVHQDISTEVGEICKELQDYCYYKLYNLAIPLNYDWVQDPDIYKTEIHLSDVEASNHYVDSLFH
jgi:hypothetical protein